MEVRFTVLGVAQPAGSKKGFYNKKTGRVIITDDAKRSRPWKALVSDAAMEAMMTTDGQSRVLEMGALLEGPLVLYVDLFFPRPKGHYGSGKNAAIVKESAPPVPAVKPDATKLLRGLEDALTSIIWRDDAQVCEQHVRKMYGEPARAEVRVATMLLDP